MAMAGRSSLCAQYTTCHMEMRIAAQYVAGYCNGVRPLVARAAAGLCEHDSEHEADNAPSNHHGLHAIWATPWPLQCNIVAKHCSTPRVV